MEEQWKDITNYENYQISTYGNIRVKERVLFAKYKTIPFHKTLSAQEIKKSKNIYGYSQVTLVNGISRKTFTIHRLVALAFVTNGKGIMVNHIDGNKSNNYVENLEWCTSKENVNHSWRLGLQKPRIGEKCPVSKYSDVERLDMKNLYSQGLSCTQIAKKYNTVLNSIKWIVIQSKY